MNDNIQFTKIKSESKSGKIILEYREKVADGKINEYTVKCHDKARPEFYSVLQDLRDYIPDICEFEPDYANTIEIRGVSLSWANDIMGAVITGLKTLKTSNSPLVINTPHLPSEPYSDDPEGNTPCLEFECVEAIENLILEAEKYLKGERAQMELFADSETDESSLKEEIKEDLAKEGLLA